MKILVFLIIGFMSVSAYAKEATLILTTASTGVVEKINVKAGQSVKKGHLLLQLDQRVYKAKLDEAIAVLKSMKLEFEEAQKELERAEELYERTVLSDHELNSAKVEFAKAESRLAKSQRQEIEAQYNFDHSQLLAPVSGKVQSVMAFPGMLVNNHLKDTPLIKFVSKK